MLLPSQMSREEFVATFGGVFEHSPWVAEHTFFSGPTESMDTLEGLHEVMCRVMRSAPPPDLQALVGAHPDLAGKLAVAGELTEASRGEQAGAGLDQCTPEEFELFDRLNSAYRGRFGFPFILAVKGRDRAVILAALQNRLANDPETELRTALSQIERIAWFRLEDILGDGGE